MFFSSPAVNIIDLTKLTWLDYYCGVTWRLTWRLTISIHGLVEPELNADAKEKDDKNSSGDEIANVNFLTTISHTHLLQNTEKETNLLRLTN